MDTDRRLRGHERPNRRILIVWALLSAIFLVIGWPGIQQGQFPDPDDALRFVQVRDLLAGQPWFDLHQYRIAPPDGVVMHWSRLVDVPLAAIILALTPLLGVSSAELVALIAVPLLTLGAVLFMIGRLAWRLFDVDVAGLACLSVGLFAPLVFQLQPMRVDHHGWQILAVAAALWSISMRYYLSGGSLAGLAMATGLSISIELLPIAAAFGLVLALRWLRDPAARWWLVSYMQALALGLFILFFATRGIAGLAQYCDAISPAHLGFFLIAAIGTGVIAAMPRMPMPVIAGLFGVTGAVGLAFFALSAPACLATPLGDLDPLVHKFWYLNIAEGRPLWEQDPWRAIPVFLQILVAFVASITLALRSHDWLRSWWTEYTLLFAAAILLSLFVWRSAAFAAVLGAVPLGWLASGLLHRFRIAQGAGQKITLTLAILMVFVPSAPFNLAAKLMPGQTHVPALSAEASGCAIRQQARRLDRLRPATIFAPFDVGPALLVGSGHSVVATSHHRAEAAMHDVIKAFTSPADGARAIIGKYDADYVVMCTDLAEPALFASANPDGLAADLLADRAPAWLQPVFIPAGSATFKVWKVRKDQPVD
ncbi:hypothetical protein [Altererythrobacter aquiaggeris]|uniref:hypothetical protein n=1 Tax=Aestuarierythrobacter aquiaggeris TaxID=1898396 RepID=UPI00301615ED